MTTTNTVILGTGIIGVSTAYYLSLSQPPSSIHLVESSPTLFASASGFAAGFLAANWFSSDVSALGKLSFDEHKRLAEEFGGREKWGYMKSQALSYSAGKSSGKKARGDDWLREGTSRAESSNESVSEFVAGEEDAPRWLSRTEGGIVEVISEEGTMAQVDPLRLCQFLLKSCLDRGVQLHHPAKAVSITKDMRDEIASIRILNTETHSETDLPCTKILIAAGAWSPQVFSTLFPRAKKKLPISSLAGHSLVLRSPRWTKGHEEKGCHAIFTTDNEGYSPEIFSRVGEEIYIAGLNSSSLALPDLATGAVVNEDAVNKLIRTSKRLLGFDGLKADEPRLVELKVDDLKVDDLKVDDLKVDDLKVDDLKVDDLKGDEPKVDDPKVEEPKVAELKGDELKVDNLKIGDLEVLRKGLCFRPVTNRGTPFLTRIPNNMLGDVRMIRGAGEGGVWLAAGHGPWGISLSLGTGKVMAEMIQGKPPSVDIRLGL